MQVACCCKTWLQMLTALPFSCRMKSSPYFLTRTVEHIDIERFSDQRTKSVTPINVMCFPRFANSFVHDRFRAQKTGTALNLINATMVIPERNGGRRIDQSEQYIPWELTHQRYCAYALTAFTPLVKSSLSRMYNSTRSAQSGKTKASIDVNMLSRLEKEEGGAGTTEGGAKEKGEGSEQVR
jgi:hypothetical protein